MGRRDGASQAVKADLISLFLVVGPASGDSILNYYLSSVSESAEARQVINRISLALLEMERDGNVERKDYKDGRVWKLTEEAAKVWCTEALGNETEMH